MGWPGPTNEAVEGKRHRQAWTSVVTPQQQSNSYSSHCAAQAADTKTAPDSASLEPDPATDVTTVPDVQCRPPWPCPRASTRATLTQIDMAVLGEQDDGRLDLGAIGENRL